ncbi:hypothetical protein Mgra_00008923 [Meloidogyne graminicola]|uniref:Uncharacterized protein n=1 Tax=Meloidogyne graminicola TaxID=189291 RepID=A0A8S9ZEK3_9BILA|nr:hypothetical protein Mgra_00008923 [Meloidogyne graminicola]
MYLQYRFKFNDPNTYVFFALGNSANITVATSRLISNIELHNWHFKLWKGVIFVPCRYATLVFRPYTQGEIFEFRFLDIPQRIVDKCKKGWSNWSDNPSVLTSDTSIQIEEYRRQMQANLLAARSAKKKYTSSQFGNSLNTEFSQKISLEPDLFDEIKPQFKAPKRLLIKQSEQQRNLFEMRDCDTPFDNVLNEKPGELGQLVDDNFNDDQESNWLSDEDNINFEQLDSVEKEQQRREREIKKQQRQLEHVRQLEQKRRLMERNK